MWDWVGLERLGLDSDDCRILTVLHYMALDTTLPLTVTIITSLQSIGLHIYSVYSCVSSKEARLVWSDIVSYSISI